MCFRNGATLNVARRDVPLRNGIIFLSALISVAGALLLSGCSGGHSSGSTGSLPTPTPTPTPTPAAAVSVSAKIVWPARSRQATTVTPINGTASGVSATITLTGTGTNGAVTVVANRPAGADTAPVTSTYALSGTAIPGNLYSLKVNFYSQASAQGSVVATASQANTLVQKDGTLLATVITTSTNVSTVTVRDVATVGSTTGLGGIIMVGQTVDALYSLYDSGGNLLAAPPTAYGSGFVTVADTTKLTTPSGAGDELVGVAPTTATTFTVSVDGVTSNPFTTEVLSTEKVAVSPNPATVSPGIAQVFTASASTLAAGDTSFGVTWTLESAAGVALTSGGATGTFTSTATTFTYTPPSTIPPTVGPFKLVAVSNYDPNVSTTVPITVASLVGVSISPNPATTISLKQTEAFTATVTNDPTAAGVTWTATGGTLSASTATSGTPVTYTAPAATGTYTLTATSIFDPSMSKSVTVTVNSLVKVAVSPNPAASLSFKQTEQFTATVTTDPTNAGVTWTATGGTLSTTATASGTALTYTAPATAGTYTLTATSVLDPTAKGTVTVTVASGVSVVVSPKTPNPIPLSINQTKSFVATVGTDPTSAGVTWTIQDGSGNTLANGGIGGSLSVTTTASGATTVYTAPSSVSNPSGTTFVLVAASVLDPTKTDKATLSVGSANVPVTVN